MLERKQAMAALKDALELLPPQQRLVVTMRDVEGFDSKDVCNLLEISETVGAFPIVFEPMALDWEEVTVLRSLIKEKCPQINSSEYSSNPQAHTWCGPEA